MCNFIFPKIIKRYSGCKCTTLVCHRANILLKIIYYYLIIQLCLTIAGNIYKLRINRAVKKKNDKTKIELNWNFKDNCFIFEAFRTKEDLFLLY